MFSEYSFQNVHVQPGMSARAMASQCEPLVGASSMESLTVWLVQSMGEITKGSQMHGIRTRVYIFLCRTSLLKSIHNAGQEGAIKSLSLLGAL